MGNWTIVISGSGSHHNGLENDVEQKAAVFVKNLEDVGQVIDFATVTTGLHTEVKKEWQLLPLVK